MNYEVNFFFYFITFQLQRSHSKQATALEKRNKALDTDDVLSMQIHHNKISATILLLCTGVLIPESTIANRELEWK